MADASDYTREKKKKVFKKIDKEFNNISFDNMKTPVATFTKQTPSSRLKSSHSSTGYFDDQSSNSVHSSNFWDKRNSRRYHADGEFRGGFGGKAWRYYEGSKELSKNDTGRPPGGSEDVASDNSPVVTPVILMREKSSLEGKGNGTPVAANTNATSQQNETETPNCDASSPISVPTPAPTRQYQIATKPSVLEAVVIPEQEMTSSLKLLDDSLLLGEDLGPYLLDQSQFLVVAVAGLQGAGKSTIASLLADPLKGLKFASTTRSWVFRPESRDEVLRGCHSTSGVDAFITKDRVIILDLQPLLSPSVMDYVVTQERKASLDYSSTENLLEIESLQLLTFALSVAHIVVVVQDYILHPNLIRLLHTCQMMKPSHSSSSSTSSSHNASSGGTGNRDGINRGPYDTSDSQQYYPHLIFVHNRAFPHQFMPKCVEELQFLYQMTLCDSNLCYESQIGICSGTFTPPLSNLSSGLNVNLFLIPDIDFKDNCAASFMESIQEMRRQLFSLSRCPLTHVTLTEKSWYQYACRMWESIRKSNLYVEYSRLLP